MAAVTFFCTMCVSTNFFEKKLKDSSMAPMVAPLLPMGDQTSPMLLLLALTTTGLPWTITPQQHGRGGRTTTAKTMSLEDNSMTVGDFRRALQSSLWRPCSPWPSLAGAKDVRLVLYHRWKKTQQRMTLFSVLFANMF